MIKNLIFDLGGVIMTIDQGEALRRFKELGLADAERQLDPYTQSGIFGDVEEGKITAEEFRVELSRLVGRELSFDDCKYGWLGYRKEVPQRNLDALRRLRGDGYRLILLSNTNPFMMSWALTKDFDGGNSSLEDYFDALYLSYRLGVMKPDPKFSRLFWIMNTSCLKKRCSLMMGRAMSRRLASWASTQCVRRTARIGQAVCTRL